MARKSSRTSKNPKSNTKKTTKSRYVRSNSVAGSASTSSLRSDTDDPSGPVVSNFLDTLRSERNSFSTFFVIFSTAAEPCPDFILDQLSAETVFHFNDANDILENGKFVLCSGSLSLLDALRNRKSYLLAISNTGSTFTATAFLENLPYISQVAKFIKKSTYRGHQTIVSRQTPASKIKEDKEFGIVSKLYV